MESDKLVSHQAIPCLLILIFSTTIASALNPFASPRLSIRPPRWLVRSDRADASSSNKLEYELYEYSQTLDHFSFRPESFTKFDQRYLVNLRYWGGAKSKSPIFVYLGAEENVIDDLNTAGLVPEKAPQFKAMIVYIEHRFYGESIPYGWPIRRAMKHKGIRGCLSTAQVLADYAEIILYLKKKYSAELSPVVVFGGSYGGMLAAWFRLKYPHVAMGALASSAPVLHHIKDHYTAYFDLVTKDYRDTSESCYWTIKNGFAKIAKVASQPHGLAKLSKKFNFCSTVNLTELNLSIRGTFKDAAQYDNPPDYQVAKACKAIDGAPKNAYILDKLLAGLDGISNFSNTPCTSNEDIEEDDDDTISYSWESCMELIHEEGVVSKDSMFPYAPFSMTNFTKGCIAKYGVPSRASYWFSQHYGGRDIKLDLRRFGSNIIFSNGMRDPWSPSGVLKNLSNTLVALTHPAAHCADVLYSAKTDPKWLTDLRKKEMAIIREWLSNYYAELRALNMA